MDDILATSIIEKVEAQQNRIFEIEAVLKNLSGIAERIEDVNRAMRSMIIAVEGKSFPVQEMKNMTREMAVFRKQLSQPVQNTVRHHHHFPKIIWFTIGLFLLLTFACSAWYFTGASLKEYKANDTKYRFLKLNPNKALMQFIVYTDSLYRLDPNMRDSVIQKEEDIRTLFKLEQEVESMKKETEKLKRKSQGK